MKSSARAVQLRELWISRIGPILPARLAEHFAAAQDQHALNPDINPRLLVVSLFAHGNAAACGRFPAQRASFPESACDHTALTKHTLALLERGLETPHAR